MDSKNDPGRKCQTPRNYWCGFVTWVMRKTLFDISYIGMHGPRGCTYWIRKTIALTCNAGCLANLISLCNHMCFVTCLVRQAGMTPLTPGYEPWVWKHIFILVWNGARVQALGDTLNTVLTLQLTSCASLILINISWASGSLFLSGCLQWRCCSSIFIFLCSILLIYPTLPYTKTKGHKN